MDNVISLDKKRIEREKERYRISIGLGVATAGFFALHTVDRPKWRAAYYFVFGGVAIGAGVVQLGSASREKL